MTEIPEHLRKRAEEARQRTLSLIPAHLLTRSRARADATTAPECTLLTDDEHEVLRLSGELASKARRIIGNGPQANNDGQELVIHIHGVQHMILRNAAARAYPDLYRLLGESLK